MKIVTCDQGSPEWHAARAGVITASMFKTARNLSLKSGPNKRSPSGECLNYAFRLAIERISGVPLDEGFETWQMRRGHELEPDARREHEELSGVLVQRAGFVTTDDGIFGGSADGLIGDDGGSEYKCLVSPEGMRKVLIDGDISEFIDQIQGCMWVTGRQWWHFALYCPALKPIGQQLWMREVKRDEAYIRDMVSDLMTFRGIVDAYELELSLRKAA